MGFDRALLVIVATLSVGCHHVADYRQQRPELDFRDFLNGKLTGWGVFSERSGKVAQRFCIDMQAGWEDGVGWLTEDFHFSGGRRQRRQWSFEQEGPNRFKASANDSVGDAYGQSAGGSMHWQYTLSLSTDSFGEQPLDFDYWMHRVDADTLVNRAEVTKYGIGVGELFVVFRRQAPTCSASAVGQPPNGGTTEAN